MRLNSARIDSYGTIRRLAWKLERKNSVKLGNFAKDSWDSETLERGTEKEDDANPFTNGKWK